MIKKILMTLAAILVLGAAGLGGFAWHIYKKDFGVNYKGRARLHYNWKYYFAERPVGEYKLEGRFISYMCPKLGRSMEMKPLEDKKWEMLYDSRNLLMVDFGKETPASIKSEIRSYLDGKGAEKPSWKFLDWLRLESNDYFKDYYKFYDIRAEKVPFDRGGEGLIVTFWSRVQERPHMKYIAGITPGGQVFKTVTQVRLNASEETYRDLVLPGGLVEGACPDPERDALSALFLKRFIETVEFKK